MTEVGKGASSVVLEGRGLAKAFGGVQALKGVDLMARAGEILAVVGENGAGKSTLMRILAGIHAPDAGELRLGGEPVRFDGPREAMAAGIGLIHQELCLCDNLSVEENILLGREPRRGGLLDRRAMRRRALEVLDRVGLQVDPAQRLGALSLGAQQLVEVAKALSLNARVLIFDEPTSSLTEREAQQLMAVVRGLAASGVAVLWISHRLAEVVSLADRAMALRDGANSGELRGAELSRDGLVRAMVGRELDHLFVREPGEPGELVLKVTGLRTEAWPGYSLDFEVHAGEVVGLAGLVGAGRSEVLETLAGVRVPVAGHVEGSAAPPLGAGVGAAVERGVVLVPEDRARQGLVTGLGVGANLALPACQASARGPFRDAGQEARLFSRSVEQVGLRSAGWQQDERSLSGGNQQKIVVGKWLERSPRLLLLDEPTRGVDVGAKAEFHQLFDRLAQEGAGILVASGEMEELFALCDRILVLAEGRLAGTLERSEFGEERLLALATPA
ncbi:MAG: sugar ABC transporter ATP-binding protein [Planctomycetota bacterium]|nr:sugar ABC transporter ATP-binding protein [Planctomycetota bacterium]